MNSPGILESVRAALTALSTFLWTAFAGVLDLGRHVGAFRSLMILVGFVGFVWTVSHLMQRRLNRRLDANPDDEVPIWLQELTFSLPGLALFIVGLPALIFARLVGAVGRLFGRGKKDDAANEPPKPVLAATLGPSFLWAGLATAALYVFALATEPVIRLVLDQPAHFPVWQYLLLGHRRELAWYLPLERFPYMAGLLATVFWFSVWWWMSRFVRLYFGDALGHNLVAHRERDDVLALWRDAFAATRLARPDDGYLEWAKWMPLVAVPFLLLSWWMLGGDPYRVPPSMFAVALVLTVSWGLHLRLRGVERLGDDDPDEPARRPTVRAAGWPDVVHDLEERLHLVAPLPARPPRRVEPLPFTRHDPFAGGPSVISPLLTELLPEAGADARRRLTHMQHAVLTSVSMAAYVHTEPPTDARSLRLDGPASRGVENRDPMRHRNQIVLAPEAAGKSTLAMLAACNHALVHTRATLVVLRDAEAADATYDAFTAALTPSTLRWNIRVRKVGGDLANDLARGIIPDVIVCSLHGLVVSILDNTELYAPFLENLGLILVDDVESFCGPVEIHAQLAFRRLTLRVRELLHVRELGEASAPVMLVLGADSMHDMPGWVRALCGVDAVARYFAHGNLEIEEREAAQAARAGSPVAEEDDEDSGESEDTLVGRYQVFYRLQDFKTTVNESLTVADIVAACERHALPWHYRPCGDDRRRLGRKLLALREEPRYHTDLPADAAVVFLQGTYAEVHRELERLSRAGARFSSLHRADEDPDSPLTKNDGDAAPQHFEPIALITLIDADEDMALTEFNRRSSLASAIASLPRPVVRPPSGAIIHQHLASDLVNHWIEVADVLDVYGNLTADTLHALARAGLLLSEARTDVHPEVHGFDERLYVRALSRAVESSTPDATSGATSGAASRAAGDDAPADNAHALLPSRVAQVEVASGRTVRVRDRTNLTVLARVDASSAPHVYYPGRIFETAQGRFIVVESPDNAHGTDEHAPDERFADVFVEPFLNDDLSSPRRRTRVQITASATGESAFVPEPILIGDYPIAVGLCAVRAHIEHVATYRLGPIFHEVRQRIFSRAGDAPPSSTLALSTRALSTQALAIFPNPESLPDAAPRLTLDDARLLAAAMRAVLPSMYRGAETSLDVALHVEEPWPAGDRLLATTDAFFLYDLHSAGNGTARAIHRDGVELLLRLARLYLERVLYHDRLLARFDHWGDTEALVRGAALESGATGARPLSEEAARAARTRVLTWLDSRLRPEGSATAGRRLGHFGSGLEDGEGDVFDIGRCWYSADGTVTDLVWTRHRWHIDDGSEALLDLGFCRATVARGLRWVEPARVEGLEAHLEQQAQNPALALDDGTIYGAPRTVWTLGPGDTTALGSEGALTNDPRTRHFQALVSALAVDFYAPLGPLADLLARASHERYRHDSGDLTEREALVTYITRFVQGIPNAAPTPSARLRSPVHTLLHRLGEGDAQSLLLAMLLRHCGIDAGLFVSMDERRVLAAVSLDGGTDLHTWRKTRRLTDRLVMGAELPPRPGQQTGSKARTFVPIETLHHLDVGTFATAHPTRWVFVPLTHAWELLGLEGPGEEVTR